MLRRFYAMNFSPELRTRLEAALPTLVFVLSLSLFGTAALWRANDIRGDAEVEIQHASERLSSEVVRRLRQPIYGLNGARGVFAHDDRLKRAEFRAYFESRDLSKEFPGARGFGFIQRVAYSELNAFVAAERTDGAPEFTVHPTPAQGQDDLYITRFIEPSAGNTGVLGLLNADPAGRSAMQRAVDSGEPTMSEPVMLLQDQRRTPGALMLVPVYRNGTRPGNMAERRAGLMGLLAAPVVFEEMLSGLPEVASGLFDIEIFDSTAGDALIYDSDQHHAKSGEPAGAPANHRYSALKTVSLMGRELSVRINAEPKFNEALDHSKPWLLFGTGSLISTLLWLYLRRRWLQHSLVVDMVEARTRDLNRERRRLQTILETATDGIHILDLDGLLVQANPAFLNMLGLDQSAIGHLHVSDWDTLDQATIRKVIASLIEAQSSSIFESQNRHSDGHLIDVEISARGINIDGQCLVYNSARDITERKRSEIAQRESLAALHLRDQALRQISQGVMIAGADRRLTYVNDESEKITGYRRQDLLGKSCAVLQGPDTKAQTVEQIRAALNQAKAFTGEILNYRKDGTLFWNDLSITPVFDEAGQLQQFIGVQRDITERKAAEQNLLEAKAAAEAANLAKSQFLATMSHEVRTPMNGILGMAQVLLMPGITEAERLDYARTILTSGQTLLKLLNDILDLAKIEAGKIELESLEMTPAQVLSQTQDLFGQSAQAKGLQIECEWTGPKTHYLGDPHRLRQMLSNLVSNALKFTAHGSLKIQAREVSCTDDKATLEFSVSDSGIGIAPEKLGMLFQAFSQVDSSTARHFGGTGLGLSLVRTLAQLMGGEAGVQSEPGRGSRFWFRIRALRLATRPVEELAPGLPADTADPHASSAASVRVLLVEDNADHRRLTALLLKQLGADVVLAENGQQGLEAVTNGEAAQIILMDLHLPVLDGYVATAQIREWEQRSGQSRRTIIALTADAYQDDREHCLAVGMNEVLTKPVSLQTLKATLKRWLPTAPSVEYRAFDAARVRSLIQVIEPLLVNHQFDATTRFRELQEAVADTELAAAIAQAGQALQEFRFAVTLELLHKITMARGWQGANGE